MTQNEPNAESGNIDSNDLLESPEEVCTTKTGSVTEWIEVPSPTESNLHAIWGTAEDDIWSVGDNGTILHYDGNAWSRVSSPNAVRLLDLWGTARDDIWAVGASGTIMRYDGRRWNLIDAPTSEWINSIFGASATNVFIAVNDTSLFRFNGTDWESVESPTDRGISYIWAPTSDHIWVFGSRTQHFDGTKWQSSPGISGLPFGSGPDDVWLFGMHCNAPDCGPAVAHFDGAEHTIVNFDGETPGIYLARDAWRANDNEYWVVGNGKGTSIGKWNGEEWIVSLPLTYPHAINGIWGTQSTNIWAVGADGVILHYAIPKACQ